MIADNSGKIAADFLRWKMLEGQVVDALQRLTNCELDLLTEDLNLKSHALLLKHISPAEFSCHFAKACHHGSEQVSSTFLQAMSPWATMFSSGDNEPYAHPRARALGLTGAFGKVRSRGKNRYLGLMEDRHVTPLTYSTELSRSIELFRPYAILDKDGGSRNANFRPAVALNPMVGFARQ